MNYLQQLKLFNIRYENVRITNNLMPHYESRFTSDND